MKKLIIFSFIFFYASNALAGETIASCFTNLNGYSYYPAEKKAKIETDRIKNGGVYVQRIGDGKYDINYVDTGGVVKSARLEGGKVFLLELAENAFTIGVSYAGESHDLYTFTKGDVNTVVLQTVRSGSHASFPKNSLLVGECQSINIPN